MLLLEPQCMPQLTPWQCVVPPGQKDCTQCKRSGVECIIKNDDERRRHVIQAPNPFSS